MRYRKTKEIKEEEEERVSSGRHAADSKACEPIGSEKGIDGERYDDDDDDDDADGPRFIGSAPELSSVSPFTVTDRSHLMNSLLTDRSSLHLTFCFSSTELNETRISQKEFLSVIVWLVAGNCKKPLEKLST